jgi:16S rRNA (guanine527-N7)-methyltransferase
MRSSRVRRENSTKTGIVSNQRVRRELATYGFSASDEFAGRICAYIDLLLRWNQRISLTTVTTPAEILRFHFGESLFAIPAAGVVEGRLADFGSGAGFPGAPLAMAAPGSTTLLIEANVRKAAFLAELRRVIGLDNVSVHAGRAETVESSEKFDFITARAVGGYDGLLTWAGQRLTSGGAIVLWLGARHIAELRRMSGWNWRNPVQIPGSRERFILKGSLV